LSAPLYRLSGKLIGQSLELIEGCGCEGGCPACVGPVGEIGERGKEAALAMLSHLRGSA
jgi:DEAD/DEAH box helicase domain-containing protein